MVEVYYEVADFKDSPGEWGDALLVPLGNVLAENIRLLHAESELPRGALVIPAPSYQGSRPHVEMLARQAMLSLPNHQLRTDVLEKVVDARQRTASRRDREEQSEHAYRAARRVDGATIVLVDDLYTTGATLRSCATALLDAGATRVYGAVIARVIPRIQSGVLFGGSRPILATMRELHETGELWISPEGRLIWLKFGCSNCPSELAPDPIPVPIAEAYFPLVCACGEEHLLWIKRHPTVGAFRKLTIRLKDRSPAEVLVHVD